MSSWLGACMIAGCAIGATGIVIHHYSSSAYQIPPKITYMINEDEWVKGVVEEFNNKVEELAKGEGDEIYKRKAVFELDSYTKQDDTTTNKHEYRAHCVSLMANAYRKEKDEDFKKEFKRIFLEDTCPFVLKEASSISV